MPRQKPDRTRLITILLVTLVMASCYFNCGTWDDDEDNWGRAFGAEKPTKGIEVVHSQYTRLAHWTTEYVWFFELTIPPAAKADIVSSPAIKRVNLPFKKIREEIQQPQPPWFLPGEMSDYEIYRNGPSSNFLLFFKRGTDICYWSASEF